MREHHQHQKQSVELVINVKGSPAQVRQRIIRVSAEEPTVKMTLTLPVSVHNAIVDTAKKETRSRPKQVLRYIKLGMGVDLLVEAEKRAAQDEDDYRKELTI